MYNNKIALSLQIKCYFQKKDLKKTEELAKTGSKKYPENPEFSIFRAWSLLELKQSLGLVLKCLQSAEKISENTKENKGQTSMIYILFARYYDLK
jgi:predicted Zn-dependent protease